MAVELLFSINCKIFIKLKILELHDVIYFHNAIFMYDYHSSNLPSIFDLFFFLALD